MSLFIYLPTCISSSIHCTRSLIYYALFFSSRRVLSTSLFLFLICLPLSLLYFCTSLSSRLLIFSSSLQLWTDLDVILYHGGAEERTVIRECEFQYLDFTSSSSSPSSGRQQKQQQRDKGTGNKGTGNKGKRNSAAASTAATSASASGRRSKMEVVVTRYCSAVY